MKVILDSNFLFIPSQFPVDIFDELAKLLEQTFDPIILSTTNTELLKKAKRGSPKMRKRASLALKLAGKCHLVGVEQSFGETPDDVIVRVAAEWKCPVATNDRILKRRLRDINLPVIYLRQKSHLEMEGQEY
jgi:rRNA-processing protein FCF1